MKLPICPVVGVCALFASLAQAEERHLFILSGQSNMQGLKEQASVLPELKKLLPGADIQHVKFAQGGQPIRKWVKTWDEIARNNKLTQQFNDPAEFYDVVIKQAKASIAEGKPDSITFLWMQSSYCGVVQRCCPNACVGAVGRRIKSMIMPSGKCLAGRGWN